MTIASYQAFSQADTSRIDISADNARRAFKELIEKDYLEKQVLSLEMQLNTQNELIQNKELETDNLNGQIEMFQSMDKSKDIRLSNSDKMISNLESELKLKNAGNTFWKLGTIAGFVYGIIKSVK